MRGTGDGVGRGGLLMAELSSLSVRATAIAEALRVIDPEWRCSWTPADVLGLAVAAGSVRQGGFLLEVGAGFSTGILASSLPHSDCQMASVDTSPAACRLARAASTVPVILCEAIAALSPSYAWSADIDVLVLDGEHTRAFALWYIENLWPCVRSGGQIVIHDMHDISGSRGEFETVMGTLWERGWKHTRTAHDKPSVGAWAEVLHAAPGVRNCLLVVTKP